MLVDQVGEVLEDLAARSWMQPRPGTMIESRTRRRTAASASAGCAQASLTRVEPSLAEFTARVEPSIAARRSPPMKRPSGMLVPAASCRQSVAATGSETMRSTSLSGVDQSIELKYVWALTIAGLTCGTSTAVDPRTTSSHRQGRG